MSRRCAGGFLVTPTRHPYDGLRPRHLVRLPGPARTASLEWRMHAAVYAARPDAGAIVHAHTPYATAWSVLGARLEAYVEEAGYYGIGEVRTAPHAPAGSAALASGAVAALGPARAVLLERHGVVALGATAGEALTVALAVEHWARVCWLVRAAG